MIQIKKTILTLVALLAVTTGAWADETPLVTIESKYYTSFMSGSKTFDDKVTVTFSNFVYYSDEDGWYADVTASLLTVAGTNGYTITSCKFYTESGDAETGYTIQGESPSVYLYEGTVFTDANQSVEMGSKGIKKIEVYGTAPAASSSGPEVAWNKAKNSGKFTMPGGNVTLEPEYYPQAVLTTQPTAINDVPATTDGAIVKAGTVANIGTTETAQGTVMYYVSTKALDEAALLALAADQWTADVPTAESFTAAGTAYVYYYVRGNDSDTDEENFSDGDILAANALQVTLGAAPLWNAEFDLTDAPEADKTGKWSTNIPEGGVTKGTEVTVTYTGSKKVIGVKAEKKAAPAAAEGHALSASVVGEIVGTDGKAYAVADKDNLPSGVTAVAMVAYKSATAGSSLAITLADVGRMNWSSAKSTCEGKTAIGGNSWKLPSQDEWKQMFSANGGNEGSYSGLNSAITTAGGTALDNHDNVDFYWSSSEGSEDNSAWRVRLASGGAKWFCLEDFKDDAVYVRACLAF